MLDAVIRWSLSHRFAVIVLWLAVSLAGVVAFAHLPLDAFPDITPVQVQVNTVAPALSPLEIERQLTFPVEQAIAGLKGLVEVRSTSRLGLSQVTVVFEDGTDIYLARQIVSERLSTVHVPPGLERPQLGPVATGLGEVFHYLVTGEGHSLSDLRTVHDGVERPQLRPLAGGAETNSWGGDERQVQVIVDPSRLARIQLSEGPSTVNREWARRRVVVQVNVRGRDIWTFVQKATARIGREVTLPPGYFVRFGGQFENLERARRRLLLVVPIALALILALLYVTYGRWRDALRVFTGVPFAAVGGILALYLRGLPFSISAGVGFVALSGVSVLGDMVLVSTIRQLLSAGRPLREAVEEAAVQRLRPVLMTALVASMGFLPMAFNTGLGAEVQRPLASVVIGGVISSTILTLLVLPAMYVMLPAGRTDASRKVE